MDRDPHGHKLQNSETPNPQEAGSYNGPSPTLTCATCKVVTIIPILWMNKPRLKEVAIHPQGGCKPKRLRVWIPESLTLLSLVLPDCGTSREHTLQPWSSCHKWAYDYLTHMVAVRIK